MKHVFDMTARAAAGWFEAAAFLTETQTVMTMRILGSLGLWRVPKGEAGRAVLEKAPAFAEGWIEAHRAFWRGAAPAAMYQAWESPVRRKVRANHKRLMRSRAR